MKGPTLKDGQTVCSCDVGWTTSAKLASVKKTPQDRTNAKRANKPVDLSKPSAGLSKPFVKPTPQQPPKVDTTQRSKMQESRTNMDLSGRVKVFFEDRQFGFITLDDMTEVWFHGSVVQGRVATGSLVKCAVETHRDKRRATAVSSASYFRQTKSAVPIKSPLVTLTKADNGVSADNRVLPSCPTRRVVPSQQKVFRSPANQLPPVQVPKVAVKDQLPSVQVQKAEVNEQTKTVKVAKVSQFDAAKPDDFAGKAVDDAQSDALTCQQATDNTNRIAPVLKPSVAKAANDDSGNADHESTACSDADVYSNDESDVKCENTSTAVLCHDLSWSGWHCYTCGQTVPAVPPSAVAQSDESVQDAVRKYNASASEAWKVPCPS